MEKKPVRIGLIGYGFMGRTHSNAYSQLDHFFDTTHVPVRQAVCGRDEGNVKAFAEKWGFASWETDWRELVKRDDINAVQSSERRRHHALIHSIERAMNSGRIHEGDLCTRAVEYAGNAIPCCLGLVRDDRHLIADKIVEQCRLSDVGTTDQSNETGPERVLSVAFGATVG